MRLQIAYALTAAALASLANCGFVSDRLQESSALESEISAIRALSALNTAQVQYFSLYGRYAQNLQQLGPPAAGASAGPEAAGLIEADLAAGDHSRYTFTMTGTESGYAVNANPKPELGSARHFYTNQDNQIRENAERPASDTDPAIQ